MVLFTFPKIVPFHSFYCHRDCVAWLTSADRSKAGRMSDPDQEEAPLLPLRRRGRTKEKDNSKPEKEVFRPAAFPDPEPRFASQQPDQSPPYGGKVRLVQTSSRAQYCVIALEVGRRSIV